MVNYTKPETRKRMCDSETFISLQQRKWNHETFLSLQQSEIIFISKDYHGEWSWEHKHALILDFLGEGDTVC